MPGTSALLVWALLFAFSAVDISDGIDDFLDHQGRIDYIYHDSLDLLLMVSPRTCVYVKVEDSSTEVRYLTELKETTEDYLYDLVHDHSSRVHASDLQTVRDEFHDMLADFHCLDKSIYRINLDFDDVQRMTLSHCECCSKGLCNQCRCCYHNCGG